MTTPHIDLAWGEPPAVFDAAVHGEGTVIADSERRPKHLTFSGLCPFCYGESSYVHQLKLVYAETGALTGQASRKSPIHVSVWCRCTMPHPGRPRGEHGCGRAWVTSVEL